MREGWSFEWKAGCNPIITKDGRRTTLMVIGDVPYLTVGGVKADAAPCTGHAAPAAPTETAPPDRPEADPAGSGVMPGPTSAAAAERWVRPPPPGGRPQDAPLVWFISRHGECLHDDPGCETTRNTKYPMSIVESCSLCFGKHDRLTPGQKAYARKREGTVHSRFTCSRVQGLTWSAYTLCKECGGMYS